MKGIARLLNSLSRLGGREIFSGGTTVSSSSFFLLTRRSLFISAEMGFPWRYELVEVKIIMDKISKRSKGYAFIEYTTEEAASVALKEMNGKIINGWMIVVDVVKTKPFRQNRIQPSSRF